MYTEQIKRNKSNAYFQMNTFTGDTTTVAKLGMSIITCMNSLKSKKQIIFETKDFSKLSSLLIQFKRDYAKFDELQRQFFDIQQNTAETDRLKVKIKQFLQSIKVEEIQQKLNNFRQNLVRQSQKQNIMYNVAQFGRQQQQTQISNQQMIRKKLLQEESQQLKVIQKLINEIKNIAIKTSSLIYEQGVNLNISAQNIKKAGQKFKQGKQELVEANKYQMDTNKKKMFFCLLIVIIVTVLLMIMYAAKK